MGRCGKADCWETSSNLRGEGGGWVYDNLRRCTPGHVKLVVFQGLWKQLSSRNIHENLSNVALTSSNACAPHNKCLRCVGVGAATGEVLLNLLFSGKADRQHLCVTVNSLAAYWLVFDCLWKPVEMLLFEFVSWKSVELTTNQEFRQLVCYTLTRNHQLNLELGIKYSIY